jgi:hypothetical protein
MTTGAMAQATDTIQGIAPPGGLGFGIPGVAIDGDVGANTGTFQFPPAGFGTHSPDSLSDWGIGAAGNGINLVTNAGTRNPVLAGNPNILIDTVAVDLFNSGLDNSFVQGTKVDDDPNVMTWALSQVNNKQDINKCGLAIITDPGTGHRWLLMSGDRLSTNGDAFIAFYIFQNQDSLQINPIGSKSTKTGGFTSKGTSAGRTIGDLLVTMRLIRGGHNPNLILERWEAVGTGFDWVDRTSIIAPGGPLFGSGFIATNHGTVNVSYGAFGGTTYDSLAYIEAALDFSAIVGQLEPCAAFNKILPVTKESQSPSATIVDFLTPVDVPLTGPAVGATGGTLTCTTTSVNLSASTAAVGAGFTWSGPGIVSGGSTATPTVSATGTYSVSVVDPTSGCTGTASALVDANVTPPGASATGGALTCTTTSASLSGATTSGTDFSWSGPGIVSGGSTATPTVSASGTYTLTTTNSANGCTSTATALVSSNTTPPGASASGGTLTCTTTTVSLSGATTSGTSFSWSGPGIVSGGATATPTVSASGTYTLTTTNSANGCTSTATALVDANVNPPGASATGGSLTCTSTSATLSAATTSGTSFSWSGPGIVSGGSTATPTVSASGTYTVTVTNSANSCTSSASAAVTSNVTPPGASATGGALTCTTTSTALSAATTSGTGFSWSGPGIVSGGATATPTVSASGTYTVTVTNSANGCTSSATASVTANTTPPNVGATGGEVTCFSPTAQLSASSTDANVRFHWSGPNGFSSSNPNPTVSDSGTYTVTVTDTLNGCTSSATAHVSVVIPSIGSCGSSGSITSGFELDGNATHVSPDPPDDWDLVFAGTDHADETTGIVFDKNSKADDYFVIGTKDVVDVTQWHYNVQSTPDKDDILHAGAAEYGTRLYFFGDRFATNGNAQIGFWFFQDTVHPDPATNLFTGAHEVGDLLVLSNFVQGGGTAVIQAFKWVGSGGSDGALDSLSVSSAAAFAITNGGATPSPWTFNPKKGKAGVFGTGAFFEGGIDVACLPGVNPCFASFLIETRASASVTAELKDFVSGRFVVGPGGAAPVNPATAGKSAGLETSAKGAVAEIPGGFALHANYPNPFNPTTRIMYDLPEASKVRLSVFNVLGQEVARLVDGEMAAGYQSVEWNTTTNAGIGLPSGIYFYRLKATSLATGEEFHDVRKMVLMK